METQKFDERFDDGEDITTYLDFDKAYRHGLDQRRVNVEFPIWMIDALDRKATRLGISRQAVIKVWIADRLEQQDQGA